MATLPMRTDCTIPPQTLALWTGGRWFGPPPGPIRGVCLDSRVLAPGDMFVALPGASGDGHGFVRAAAAQGAAAALVSQPDPGVDLPLLLVDDTMAGLRAMAAHRRRAWGGTMIALTSSVGKTTVKDMAAAILAQAAPTHATPGNFNGVTGVPLTLLSLPAEARFAVVEIGMSFPGEIRSLVPLVQPDVAGVINVRPVHLENFPSIAAIADAKAEILLGLRDGGVAVLNADDPLVRPMAVPDGVRRVWFGSEASCDLQLLPEAAVEVGRQRFSLRWHDTLLDATIVAPGRYNRVNAAAAAALALAAGAEIRHVVDGLAAFRPSPLRSRLVHLAHGSILFEDCYNASPDAVTEALGALAELPVGGRRVFVFGDMRELGASSQAFHRDVGARAAAVGVGVLLAFGPLSQAAVAAYRRASPHGTGVHFDTIEALVADLIERHQEGDVVLVKGSRAMRMERVSAALIAHFGRSEQDETPSPRG